MDNETTKGSLATYLAPVPALLLAAIIIALHVTVPPHPTPSLSFEPPLLLPILNT